MRHEPDGPRNDALRQRSAGEVIRRGSGAVQPSMDSATIETTTSSTARSGGPLLRIVGAALLAATAGIHLDLYLTGYRHIPTIGMLFIAQVVAALILAGATIVSPRRAVALAGAGFAASTLGGYILSLWFGLFGFNEIRTTAGVVAGAIEVAALVALATYAAFFAPSTARTLPEMVRAGRRSVVPIGALAVLALALAVANSPGSTTGPSIASPSASSTAKASATKAASGSVKVAIKNFAFIPSTFSVKPGEAIVVTNDDSVTHTFTATPGSTPAGKFDSGHIAPGKTVTVTAPTAAGSYGFYCAIHPFMTGTLTVS